MQFPVHSVYEFLSNFVINFFSFIWNQDVDGQGVERKEKKIDPQKENLNYTP